MLSRLIKRQANTFFMIVPRKARKKRRSLCYDRKALDTRKEHKPKDSAVDMAAAIGVEDTNRTGISRVSETRNFRHKNVELGKDTS